MARKDQKLGIRFEDHRGETATVERHNFTDHREYLDTIKEIMQRGGDGEVIKERTFSVIELHPDQASLQFPDE